MPDTIANKPCRECPFRRDSAGGYTGEAEPADFLAATLADVAMPCHSTIDYTDEDWKEKWEAREAGAHCAGAAIFFANMCKISRDRTRPRLTSDKVTVFATLVEFADHHKAELPPPYTRTAKAATETKR